MVSEKRSRTMTSESWKRRLAARARASRLALLALSAATLSLGFSSCPTKPEVDAAMWLNNGLPADLCFPGPEASAELQAVAQRLREHGFYRRLNAGGFELVSFCKPEAREFSGMHKRDLEELLSKLPKGGE